MGVLYYLGIVQKVIVALGRFMRWTIGTSGAEDPLLQRQHLHRAHRSAAPDQAVPPRADPVGAAHGDDRWLRDDRRWRPRGLHRVGNPRVAPDRGDGDVGAGGARRREDHLPGEGGVGDRGRDGASGDRRRRQPDRGRRQRDHGRAQAGSQRRRHADRVHRPDRGGRRNAELLRRLDRRATARGRDRELQRRGDVPP